eukprot:TRINITY_DN3857_c0_g1_i1.p2 TRINITY_DN3857_c0_g1~~TRINITY_DN3857_c0_g1_i1.p2  ORF type:complete len:372 (+),score=40.87 TRINITY_DN3857_c0_g1_i1:3659-4774(+)
MITKHNVMRHWIIYFNLRDKVQYTCGKEAFKFECYIQVYNYQQKLQTECTQKHHQLQSQLACSAQAHLVILMSISLLGYVFEAYDLEKDRKVAVKRVRKAERKVSREYQILSEIKGNKYCIELLDIFYTVAEDNKLTQNFVFEYVPSSLEKYINEHKKRARIPIVTIKAIMRQLLEGLEFVHSKNICHRDLKPDNILLDDELHVKICDFGSAKILDGKSKKNIPHIVNKFYRAPELLFCRTDYTTKIDVWAAGCIFIEMFTLEPVFPGKTEGLQLLEIMAILGSPSKEDKEYLYESISLGTKKMVEQIETFKPVDLKKVFPPEYTKWDIEQAADLAQQMLAWNPEKRISAKQALKHKFFKVFQFGIICNNA